uniref:Uncharacterized protein n=1 Tax=Desertifilum tharense IPPAS B-1220 TaxID=1781255 RepID=A0ACD5H1I9_9CYAN
MGESFYSLFLCKRWGRRELGIGSWGLGKKRMGRWGDGGMGGRRELGVRSWGLGKKGVGVNSDLLPD